MRWIITENGVRLKLCEISMIYAESEGNEATKFTLMAGIKASQTAVILKHDISHDTAEKIIDRITDRITDYDENWIFDLRKEYVEN